MLLLPKLPPINLPMPISFDQWKDRIMESEDEVHCEECDNTRKIECSACQGTGTDECHCCGHETDCDECDGYGEIPCECESDGGRIDFDAYLTRVADDYEKLLSFKNFVMPRNEIFSIARANAKYHNVPGVK